MERKKGVLFVCSHNSARSQMAEGWLRHLAGDRFESYSAGVEPGLVNPLTVRAMAEAGVDISDHTAKGIEVYLSRVPIYHLVVVCDKAAKTCPRVWPGARERHHWFFPDPSAAEGSEEEKMEVFRAVRDEIRERIEAWLVELDAAEKSEAAR